MPVQQRRRLDSSCRDLPSRQRSYKMCEQHSSQGVCVTLQFVLGVVEEKRIRV